MITSSCTHNDQKGYNVPEGSCILSIYTDYVQVIQFSGLGSIGECIGMEFLETYNT